MKLNPDQYKLSEEKHQDIFQNQIVPEIFASAKFCKRPIAIILGGQPGAGKTAFVEAAKQELMQQGGVVEINGDDLRDYHPQYGRLMSENDKTSAFYTDRDSGRWVEKSIAEAKVRRVNLVIEGTMRDGDKVAATMQSLREAGYMIDARALAVTAKFSEQGILSRYEGQKYDKKYARMTTPEAHKAGYDGMLKTLDRIETDKLADRVTVYQRGAKVLYTNTLKDGQWEHEPNARAIVEAERARPMTLQERRDYLEGFDKLADMLAKPERQASTEEIRAVQDLRQQAKVSLAAEIFRQESPEKVVQQFPELASAYGYVRACEAKAEADGLNAEQRTVVMTCVRENVAQRIERGDVPNVQIREERQMKTEQQRDPER